jgi:nucleotide-binding universal stress UspA family protein
MKILMAIDGSECNDAAVTEISRRPWPSGSEIRLLTVDPPMDSGLLRHGSVTVLDELVQSQRQEALRCLNAAAAVFQQNAPDLLVTPVLREGWPKEVILNEARDWGADLIVVGSHGYGTLQRLFLGSVSLAVASNASCSVEIVRAPPSSTRSAAE